MASTDSKIIEQDGSIEEHGKTFGPEEHSAIAEMICDTKNDREKRRKDREKQWKEVDRQVEMHPDLSLKQDVYGVKFQGRQWFPELEMHHQATALEIDTADCRRFNFPRNGRWFRAHANVTDEFLEKIDFTDIVTGDNLGGLPSQFTQQDIDEIIESYLISLHGLYDFRGEWDQQFAEALKYGVMVGNLQMSSRNIFLDEAHGVNVDKDKDFPVGFAKSIWNTYLDDTCHRRYEMGSQVGPLQISCYKQYYADLLMIAEEGKTDPDDDNGGWLPENIVGIGAETTDEIELLEGTGDFLVSKTGRGTLYLQLAVATVAIYGGKQSLIRLKFLSTPFNPYYTQTYMQDGVGQTYGSSPLLKGRTLQRMLSLNANLLEIASMYQTLPPIRQDPNDPWAAARGQTLLQPGQMYDSATGLEPIEFGNPTAMFANYQGLDQAYAQLTGINAARIGAQTKSHTTAFANASELERGQVRIIDFIASAQDNVFTSYLQKEYWMARRFRGRRSFLMQKYGVYVTIDSNFLPKDVTFEVFGAGTPAVDQAEQQRKDTSLQRAVQIDTLQTQMGNNPRPLDMTRIKYGLLDDAGIADAEEYAQPSEQGSPGIPDGTGQLPGIATGAVPIAAE